MVLKLNWPATTQTTAFENDVKMYGTQACRSNSRWHLRFENDVKMYGTQAVCTDATVSDTV